MSGAFEEMYKCEVENCGYETSVKSNLTKHQKNVHLKIHKCGHCNKKFQNEQERNEHEIKKHQINCYLCDYKTTKKEFLKKHYETEHSQKRKQEGNEKISNKRIKHNKEIQNPPPAPPPAPPQAPTLQLPYVHPQGRFKNILFTQKYKPNPNLDLLKTQTFYKKILQIDIKRKMSSFGQIKFYVVFTIKFNKFKDDELVYAYQHFNAGTQTVLHEGEVEEKIDLSMQQISGRVEEFLQLGSGWVYEETSKIDLSVFKYKP